MDPPPPPPPPPEVPVEEAAEAPQEKKKRKLVYIINGHVNTKDRREGKKKTDTYYKQSIRLVQASKDLYSITGAEVKVETLPNWPEGKKRGYESPGYKRLVQDEPTQPQPQQQAQQDDDTEDGPQAEEEVGPRPRASPSPRKRVSDPPRASERGDDGFGPSTSGTKQMRPAGKYNQNYCGICGIQYRSAADFQLPDQTWIKCTKTCNFWVHSRCVGMYYPVTKAGETALKKWVQQGHFFCPKHMPTE